MTVLGGMLNTAAMRLDRGQIEVVDDIMVRVLSRKSAAERIGIGFDMWLSAREMLISHLSDMHPDWNRKKVQSEAAKRLSCGAL